MALLKNGIYDINTGSDADLKLAADDLVRLLDATNARVSINASYSAFPADEIWLSQAWSGDMVGRPVLPAEGRAHRACSGYWYPKKRNGEVNNDTMVIPTSSQHPVAAHTFINFMLDKKYAFENFADWVGYQPPQNSINPSELIADGVVPKTIPEAVVRQDDFKKGHLLLELNRDTDQLWFDAWDQVTSGG